MLSVCIASRGRPELLRKTIATLTKGMVLPDTIISVALDHDDPELPNYDLAADRVRISIADREDTIGAKYNRAQSKVAASVYLLWADDMVMPDEGWDRKIVEAANRLQDHCGAVFFGQIPGVMQPGMAITHELVEAMGFLNQPFTSFWWGETWVIEIVRMADRAVNADIRVELLQPVKGTSRGVRDIAFWGTLFDRLRPQRRAVAEKIIDAGTEIPARKAYLKSRFPEWEAMFLQSNAACSNPESAAKLEAHYSYDAPADERYMRVKAKAEQMLETLA